MEGKKLWRIFAPHLAQGRIPEWPNGADCKSAGVRLRWFESITSHEKKSRLELQDPDDARQSGIGAGEADSDTVCFCGSSSVDRASAFQAEGREFEPRLPLKIYERVPFLGTLFLCILENSDNFASL